MVLMNACPIFSTSVLSTSLHTPLSCGVLGNSSVFGVFPPTQATPFWSDHLLGVSQGVLRVRSLVLSGQRLELWMTLCPFRGPRTFLTVFSFRLVSYSKVKKTYTDNNIPVTYIFGNAFFQKDIFLFPYGQLVYAL